ncbi:MAG: DUF5131 family protein [Xanthomonadaceae bacterium]|nr:DUF5131 family protein [Xanthomonadaceae bacterium]
MPDRTKIEWTAATWNPLRGCTRVSEGCRNCYAETVAARFSNPSQPYHGLAERTPSGPRWTGKVELIEHLLDQPLLWKKPRRIFVNSMSDLFHESVPFGWIMRVIDVIGYAPRHTFQILTKRPDRMSAFFAQWTDFEGEDFEPKMVRGPAATRAAHPSGRGRLFADMLEAKGTPPPGAAFPTFDWIGGMIGWPSIFRNVWLGVSVEDQVTADERIPLLLETPAAKRFISAEPLLGPITIPPGLDWVIAGGESGPNARPAHPDWFRSLRDQCADAGVPFFFKQWGEWHEFDTGPIPQQIEAHTGPADDLVALASHPGWIAPDGRFFASQDDLPADETPCRFIDRVGKRRAGRLLDGREHNEFPDA